MKICESLVGGGIRAALERVFLFKGGEMPQAKMTIETVSIQRGETITLWLDKGKHQEQRITQIEIRLTLGGDIECFCDEQLSVQSFEEWRPLFDISQAGKA